MKQSFFWYDLETFGLNPGWDRIAQFAGMRTDLGLVPLDDPIVLYCKIPADYLPDPRACLLTGITPQETLEKGLREIDFISHIYHEFIKPGTCVVGYNNLHFDDEFIRNTLYRNFFDPYLREYAQGNSRWDLLDVVRMTHDLRPEGIEWPMRAKKDTVRPSFKLEDLAKANYLEHGQAHNALNDVLATIEMAKLIRSKQPKLYNYAFSMRSKNALRRLLDLHEKKPLLLTHRYFTTPYGCTAIVIPLAVDPRNNNAILIYDLRQDPTPLLEMNTEDIQKEIFYGDNTIIPIYSIALNRSPAFSPVKTVDKAIAKRLHLNLDECLKNHQKLTSDPLLTQKVTAIFQDERQIEAIRDPDLQIYSGGFFPDEDLRQFQLIRSDDPQNLAELKNKFEDPRVPEMIWRFTARNYPEILESEETKRWKSFCAGRILFPKAKKAIDFGQYKKIIDTQKDRKDLTAGEKLIIKALDDYRETIEKNILLYTSDDKQLKLSQNME